MRCEGRATSEYKRVLLLRPAAAGQPRWSPRCIIPEYLQIQLTLLHSENKREREEKHFDSFLPFVSDLSSSRCHFRLPRDPSFSTMMGKMGYLWGNHFPVVTPFISALCTCLSPLQRKEQVQFVERRRNSTQLHSHHC